MPKLARNYEYGYGQRYAQPQRQVAGTNPNFRKPLPKRAKKKVYKVKSKKFNPIASLARLAIGAFFAGIVIPYSFNNYTLETFYNPIKNRNIKVDYRQIMTPTMAYMSNDYFVNTPMRSSAADKNSIMQHLFESNRMTLLETRLMQLMKQYPMVKPAIYVWEYEHGKYVNINADEEFPVASIIKIPVLIEMFRSIEAGQFKLYDTMVMGEHYVTPGSGSLQFSQVNSVYSMDKLARHMIEESDNTSTNMIMSKIGGKHSVNRSIKNWGMKNTRIQNWLPDMGGENVSTAKEMSTIIYNINNDSLLNINSRESIIDYMSHVKNNRLIQAGLPADAQFVHKTGDIGYMLGDAGVVYAPNGKRYVVTILAKRPYNNYAGKEFIVEASKIIYDYVVHNKI